MSTLFVDGQPYTVADGQNVLQACLGLGFDLPYFCWHPAMGSVGACRQCAVKQFRSPEDQSGRLVMACMTPATDGTRVSMKDPEAHEFRENVIAWMMLNHPHDCPVCDEGGECHLQDMTVMTGHDYRAYRGKKRTFYNQDLGPFVNHEMNRCIQCYRCVRFYCDYAGGEDFNAFRLRNIVYFGREQDGKLESEFSGNLVEVCPTGVFTDKTLKQHYTRKWDLQTAPSICVNCSVGCNTIPGERYGLLRRIRNRYNGAVNGYFLCDRGRYGYEFVNSDRRIRQPLLRQEKDQDLTPVSNEAAMARVRELMSGKRTVGIGSPRASIEANFALRQLVGAENFFAGVSDAEWQLLCAVRDTLQTSPARSSSLAEVAAADAVLVLGEDVTNTAPMIALALRQAVRNEPMRQAEALHVPRWDDAGVRELAQKEHGPLWMATAMPTRLDDIATSMVRGAPADIARLGFAVAHAIEPGAPAVDDVDPEMEALVSRIAEGLAHARAPLVVSGTGAGDLGVIEAAGAVATALRRTDRPAALSLAIPECNSLGVALMATEGIGGALRALREGDAGCAIVLENDIVRRAGERVVEAAAQHADLVVLDSLDTSTTALASVVLPAATFAEGDGTLVNNEGRAQRFFQVFVPVGDARESWRWLGDMMGVEHGKAWADLDEVLADIARGLPVFAPIVGAAPPASLRIAGQKVAREPHRYSGRTAITANVTVNEPPPPRDVDSALSFSMEGFQGEPPPALMPRFWAPGWNSIQALNKFQEEVAGPLRGGDPGQRLIEPAVEGSAYPAEIPAAFAPRDGQWLAVPIHHIFGSEEQSSIAGATASLAHPPYIALNSDEASRLSAREADAMLVVRGDDSHELPLRILPLPDGLAGFGAGLRGGPLFEGPTWLTLRRSQETP